MGGAGRFTFAQEGTEQEARKEEQRAAVTRFSRRESATHLHESMPSSNAMAHQTS